MPEPADSIIVTHLKKCFGPTEVIHDLSFTVPIHHIVGFLGPNGAGKTTVMRMLVGLSKPASGEIQINEQPVKFGSNQAIQSVGYLPELPSLYRWMTAAEYIDMVCGLYHLPNLKSRRDSLLKQVGLYAARHKRIGSYSGGMTQRLGIAQALVNEPKVLIMDEPMASLDPMGRKEVLSIIAEMRQRMTILFSTHILADVDRICDDVIILNQGRLIAQAPLAELKRSYAQPIVTVELAAEASSLLPTLTAEPWQKRVEINGNRIKIWLSGQGAEAKNAPLKYFAQQSLPVLQYGYALPDVEDLFVGLLQQDGGKESHE